MEASSREPRRRSSWGERIAFLLLVVAPFLVVASCALWCHCGVGGIGGCAGGAAATGGAAGMAAMPDPD